MLKWKIVILTQHLTPGTPKINTKKKPQLHPKPLYLTSVPDFTDVRVAEVINPSSKAILQRQAKSLPRT